MKTSRFIGYSFPGHILCRLLRYQSCYNRLRCLYPNIENGELCSVYGSVGALAVRGNNSMLCLAMMYEEVFSWEPFRKRDRSIAFFVPNKINGTKEAMRMAYGYAKQIQNRIGTAPDGTIFIVSDFSDVADSETIRRNLNRLVQAGTLRRILKGVFEKPKFSKLLGEYVAADPDAVAKALARCYHWTIAPCGDTALNMLGLSTQVTAVWSYISDGPYKTYEWDKTKIEFKHRTNKEVTGLSPMTILVIQALKTLGKEHVDEKTIRVLSRRLNEDEKAALLAEGAEATDWIYTVIKEICKGEREND